MPNARSNPGLQLLKDNNVYDNTVIFYTADNGPHQGAERTNIRWSTNFLRQCKASMWEGGIRVPGMVHFPRLITENKVGSPQGAEHRWDLVGLLLNAQLSTL